MPSSVAELVELLDVEQLEVNLFRGRQPADSRLKRVFGGQVAGQAVMAALKTVPADRHLHSLHVYFLRGGDPGHPIVYDAESVRDGRSFTTRRVAARQHGEIIFDMTASFQVDEEGWSHQDDMPETPGPEDSIPMMDLIGQMDQATAEDWHREWGSFDVRYVGDPRPADDPARAVVPVVQRLWFRARGDLGNDPAIHQAAFAYGSDFSLLGTALLPHGILINSPRVQPASLDHVIWFHRPFRVDEWFLYDQTSPSASGARGLATARVFTQDGTLVATVAQEGLIRPAREQSPSVH